MKDPLITETSPRRALDKIFKNSPKHSTIKLISCSDRYGDMLITETQRYFIPWLNNDTQKTVNEIRNLLNKPRRSKKITVGGLERYLKYISEKWVQESRKYRNTNINRTSNTTNNNDSMDKSNATYNLTDDGTGKKYDSGKSMVGTLCRIFPRALLGVGKCIEFGTHKYPKPDNWAKVNDGFNRYSNSLMRHLLKIFAGQKIDAETGLPHIYHCCWNVLAMAEFYIKENPDETLLK